MPRLFLQFYNASLTSLFRASRPTLFLQSYSTTPFLCICLSTFFVLSQAAYPCTRCYPILFHQSYYATTHSPVLQCLSDFFVQSQAKNCLTQPAAYCATTFCLFSHQMPSHHPSRPTLFLQSYSTMSCLCICLSTFFVLSQAAYPCTCFYISASTSPVILSNYHNHFLPLPLPNLHRTTFSLICYIASNPSPPPYITLLKVALAP
jgi:hypothetical protein